MNYSIVIRTLGTTGEKYGKLLESIKALNIQPQEVVVVLPHGYALPPEQLGTERFVYSEKGMIWQRAVGIREAMGDYLLVVDDDVYLPPDLPERLYAPIQNEGADVTFPIDLDFLPPDKLSMLMGMINLNSMPMLWNKKNWYVRILKNGGWTYNRVPKGAEKSYLSHSFPGTCHFGKREALQFVDLEKEFWCEKCVYALYEDQVLAYKLFLNHYVIRGVPHTGFIHLNAGGNNPDRPFNAAYALIRNRIVFWHRYILLPSKNALQRFFAHVSFRLWLIVGDIIHGLMGIFFKNRVMGSPRLLAARRDGKKDGFAYLKTEEYKNLPPVIKREE